MAHRPASPSPIPAPAAPAWRRHRGRLLYAGGLAGATLAFVGYGQPELLLEAVNLRYCG